MNTGHRSRSLLICALLCAVTLIAYWPLRDNDFINLDDYVYISKNPHVQSGLTRENVKWSFQVGYAGNWHPLTWLSHMLDVQLFGLDPHRHHLVNLLFHTVNTLLLFLVLQGMTRRAWRSAMVAALFAVHPLHVESVAWAAERKDVLSAFFFLLTLWAYARHVEHATGARWQVTGTETAISTTDVSRVTGHRSPSYWLALLFFALGLMSKPMLVTVPFVLLLLDVWPLQRVEFTGQSAWVKTLRSLVWEKIPFLILSLASSWVTFMAQVKGEAVSTVTELPWFFLFANAAVSYIKYLDQNIWPVNLAVFYPFPTESSLLEDWRLILAVLALPAVSGFVLLGIKRVPWFATGWFWFLGTLVPVCGIVQVGGQAMADRFTYLPLIGLFICLVWGGAGLFAAGHCNRKIPAAAGVAVVVACAALTHQQVQYWRDGFTIANHALAVTGNNYVAEDILGEALGDQGKYDLAAQHFRAALAAYPDYASARYDLAVALTRSADAQAADGKLEEAVGTYQSALQVNLLPQTLNHLGLALRQLGRQAEAIQQYYGALRLQPDGVEARFNLASALAGEGKIAEAEKHFAEARRLSPNPARLLLDYGRVLASQGKLAEARVKFREAVRLCPTNAEANLELGMNLRVSGQTNEAAKFFSAARQLDPDLAERNWRDGKTFAEQGRVDAALRCLTIATWLKPEDAAMHEDLGMFCVNQGWPVMALTQFEETLRLRPDATSHRHLGLALFLAGRSAEAVNHYETAIKLNPDSPRALSDFAWLLATTPDTSQRNGARAVALAEQACRLTNYKQPLLIGTLAAAYAETGRFAKAKQTAEKAIALAAAENNPELVKRNQEFLELYRAGKTVAQDLSHAVK
jgi:tetratricopeptide (TPR) repeat protein